MKYGVRGKMLDIIKSMCENVRSRVKYNNTLSDDFSCFFGGQTRGITLSFLFSMHLNDIEEHFILIGFEGIDLDLFNLFLLFYADDIVIMSETEEGLKLGLFLLENYCDRWNLTVNATNTKVMILRKGGRVNRNIRCIYK